MHGLVPLSQSSVFALLKGVLLSKLCISNYHMNSLNTYINIAENWGVSDDLLRDAATPAYNAAQNKRNRETTIANKKRRLNDAGVA